MIYTEGNISDINNFTSETQASAIRIRASLGLDLGIDTLTGIEYTVLWSNSFYMVPLGFTLV